MEWDVMDVKVVGPHTLFVQFRDGVQGEMEFKPSRSSRAYLINPQAFEAVRVVDGVVTWPEELDLPPDVMHDEIKRNGRWIVR